MTREGRVAEADKSAVMTIRMRPSQKTLVRAAAEAEGVSASTWARQVLHEVARERFRALLRESDPGGELAPETREALEAVKV